MGASAGYCRPVEPTNGRMSSWTAHTNRGVPSTEPGTDYYCPRGTPVRAAASGRVVDVGDSIQPATGRYVTIDLDDGRRVRYLHLERRHVKVDDRVQWGQHIADSGATGYGEADWSWNVAETGGAHVHMTLWPGHYYAFGRYTTLDPEDYTVAGSGGNGDEGVSVQNIFDARDGDGRNMLDLGRQIRSDLSVIRQQLEAAARLDAQKDYPAFAAMQQRAYRYDVRVGGVGADWKLGPTIFELLNGAQAKSVTPEQVKQIADAVTAAVGRPDVEVDDETIQQIAQAVNDEAAKRLAG